MLKKFALGALIALSMSAGAQGAVAGPGNCDCFWVTERNADGHVIGGYWECPDPSICQITVEP